MKVRGCVCIYGYFMALLGFGATALLYFAKDAGLLPEGLILCGAVLCGFSVMFGIFLLEFQSDRMLSAFGAGPVLSEQDCVLHVDKTHGRWYHIAICTDGVVLDAYPKHFEILDYGDMRVLKASEFEVLVKAYDNSQYRFVFQKKLKAAALRDAFATKSGLEVQELARPLSGKSKIGVRGQRI